MISRRPRCVWQGVLASEVVEAEMCLSGVAASEVAGKYSCAQVIVRVRCEGLQ